jgi:hypothetical protein
MPQSDQLFCKIAHDALSTSVFLRRHAFHQRGGLNNSQSLHRPPAFLLAATERWWPAPSGAAQHHMNQYAMGRFVPRPRSLHGSPEPHCALLTLGGPAVFVIFAPCERLRAGPPRSNALGLERAVDGGISLCTAIAEAARVVLADRAALRSSTP